MHYITFALLFVTPQQKNLSYIFGNCKRPFHTKSEINKPQAEVCTQLPIFLNIGTGETSVNKLENRVTCITHLKK